jgi:hypothetical protein
MQDNGPVEIVRIQGLDIEVETIPSPLRRKYETARASRDYATKTGNGVDAARAELKKIGTDILVAMAPYLAIRAAQKNARRGARGLYEGLGYI